MDQRVGTGLPRPSRSSGHRRPVYPRPTKQRGASLPGPLAGRGQYLRADSCGPGSRSPRKPDPLPQTRPRSDPPGLPWASPQPVPPKHPLPRPTQLANHPPRSTPGPLSHHHILVRHYVPHAVHPVIVHLHRFLSPLPAVAHVPHVPLELFLGAGRHLRLNQPRVSVRQGTPHQEQPRPAVQRRPQPRCHRLDPGRHRLVGPYSAQVQVPLQRRPPRRVLKKSPAVPSPVSLGRL